jgi:hypothetical protein
MFLQLVTLLTSFIFTVKGLTVDSDFRRLELLHGKAFEIPIVDDLNFSRLYLTIHTFTLGDDYFYD